MWAEKVDTRSPDHTYWLLVLPSSHLYDIENHFIFKARYCLGSSLQNVIDTMSISSDILRNKTPLKMKYWIYAGNGVYET